MGHHHFLRDHRAAHLMPNHHYECCRHGELRSRIRVHDAVTALMLSRTVILPWEKIRLLSRMGIAP